MEMIASPLRFLPNNRAVEVTNERANARSIVAGRHQHSGMRYKTEVHWIWLVEPTEREGQAVGATIEAHLYDKIGPSHCSVISTDCFLRAA